MSSSGTPDSSPDGDPTVRTHAPRRRSRSAGEGVRGSIRGTARAAWTLAGMAEATNHTIFPLTDCTREFSALRPSSRPLERIQPTSSAIRLEASPVLVSLKYAAQWFRSVIVLGAHPYSQRLCGDFEGRGQNHIDLGVETAIERRKKEPGPFSDEQKAELETRDWKALGATPVATGKIKGLEEGLLHGRTPYLLLCGTEDENHELVSQAAGEFPNVVFKPLEGLDHRESRSRLDVLIPIAREFFGSTRGVASAQAK